MDSLWPTFDDTVLEENNAIEILRFQARDIKTKTNGIVNATFSKLNYLPGPTQAVKTLKHAFDAMSSSEYKEKTDTELENKKDINDLYSKTKYKFELYNKEYRFRMFILEYCDMFPISLDVDEGVLENVNYINHSPISSNYELENILQDIFSSPKVRSVVSKMIQAGEKKEQE